MYIIRLQGKVIVIILWNNLFYFLSILHRMKIFFAKDGVHVIQRNPKNSRMKSKFRCALYTRIYSVVYIIYFPYNFRIQCSSSLHLVTVDNEVELLISSVCISSHNFLLLNTTPLLFYFISSIICIVSIIFKQSLKPMLPQISDTTVRAIMACFI